MLIFNTNQLNSLQEIFVTVLILHQKLIFLAFRAYLLEPPPQDYITKGKTKKNLKISNEVKNGCTRSRIRIVLFCKPVIALWRGSNCSSLEVWKLRTKYKENKRSKDVSVVLSCTCKSIVYKNKLILRVSLFQNVFMVSLIFPKKQSKNLMNFCPRI